MTGCDSNGGSSSVKSIEDDFEFVWYKWEVYDGSLGYMLSFDTEGWESGIGINLLSFKNGYYPEEGSYPEEEKYTVIGYDKLMELYQNAISASDFSLLEGYAVVDLSSVDSYYEAVSGAVEYTSAGVELVNVLFKEPIYTEDEYGDEIHQGYVEGTDITYSGYIKFSDLKNANELYEE